MTKTPTRPRRLASVLMAGFGATLMFLTAPAFAQPAAETSAASPAPVTSAPKGGTSDFRGRELGRPAGQLRQ